MKKKITSFIAILLYYTCTGSLFAQDGHLDKSFGGGDGKVTTGFGQNDYANAIAIQPDGKLIAAGYSANLYVDFAVARYNINGTPDKSFGGGDGKVLTDFGDLDYANAVAIQKDGKIVVAGNSWNTGNDRVEIARYNTDGTLDKSFGGGDGKVISNFGGLGDYATCVAILPNGKIAVGGYTNKYGNNDFLLAEYNSNGTLNQHFGNNGYTILAYNPTDEACSSMAVQPNGKIVLAGGSSGDFALARFNSNGTLDLSFGLLVKTSFGAKKTAGATSIAIQSNGKIVLGGQVSDLSFTNTDVAIARYNTNGTLDNSFSVDGLLNRDFGAKELIFSIAVQSNGKIIVAGSSQNGLKLDFLVARFGPNGYLDNSFNGNGRRLTSFNGNDYNYAAGMIIQPNGKIVLAGRTNNGNNTDFNFDFALARYNGDDVSFSARPDVFENNSADALLNSSTIIQQNIILLTNAASLSQNIPNPFTNTTTIGYTLPQKFSSAKIIITDKNGRQLKQISLSAAGKGRVDVDASTQASGAYNYSLYVDGRFVASKQMELLK